MTEILPPEGMDTIEHCAAAPLAEPMNCADQSSQPSCARAASACLRTALAAGIAGWLGCSAAQPAPVGCILIDRAGYVIDKPGIYCVTKDLHTRLDFADHSAESPVIFIRAGDVTVDLMGHTLGRGRWFTQPGGFGIGISTQNSDDLPDRAPTIRNVVIRNGVLSDFLTGVHFFASKSDFKSSVRAVSQPREKTFAYAPANIVIEDVTFSRCESNLLFFDWVAP